MCNEKIFKKGVDTSHNVVLSLDHQNNVTQRKQSGGTKMKTLEARYSEALKAIGIENFLNLPEEVKKVLQETADFETKVKMFELIAEAINK